MSSPPKMPDGLMVQGRSIHFLKNLRFLRLAIIQNSKHPNLNNRCFTVFFSIAKISILFELMGYTIVFSVPRISILAKSIACGIIFLDFEVSILHESILYDIVFPQTIVLLLVSWSFFSIHDKSTFYGNLP